MIDGADARQQQRRNLRVLHQRNHRAQILFVARRGKTVVHRCAAEPVAVRDFDQRAPRFVERSEEHTSELQSLMSISYAVFCLKKKITLSVAINKIHKRNQKSKQIESGNLTSN